MQWRKDYTEARARRQESLGPSWRLTTTEMTLERQNCFRRNVQDGCILHTYTVWAAENTGWRYKTAELGAGKATNNLDTKSQKQAPNPEYEFCPNL